MVWPIGTRWIAAVFGSLGHLFKAAAVPFVLSLVVAGLFLIVDDNLFVSLILTLFGLVPYTLFGVAWHRLTLLGPKYGAPKAIPSWEHRHWQFLGYVVAITVLIWALFLAIGVLTTGIGGRLEESSPLAAIFASWLVPAIVLYPVLRFSFVFPAAAVEESYSLRDSWLHTRGQGLRLFSVLLAMALPMMFLLLIVVNVTNGVFVTDAVETHTSRELANVETHWIQFLQSVFVYIFMALAISAISIAFRTCTGWVPLHADNHVGDETL